MRGAQGSFLDCEGCNAPIAASAPRYSCAHCGPDPLLLTAHYPPLTTTHHSPLTTTRCETCDLDYCAACGEAREREVAPAGEDAPTEESAAGAGGASVAEAATAAAAAAATKSRAAKPKPTKLPPKPKPKPKPKAPAAAPSAPLPPLPPLPPPPLRQPAYVNSAVDQDLRIGAADLGAEGARAATNPSP